MKLKTLLKTLCNVEIIIMDEYGNGLDEIFISDWDYKNKNTYNRYEGKKVLKITTLPENDKLYVRIEY